MALITKDAIDEIIQLSRQSSVSREDIVTLNNAIRSEASARKLADKVVAKTSTEIIRTYNEEFANYDYTVKWNFNMESGLVIPWFLVYYTTDVHKKTMWGFTSPYTIEEAKDGITFHNKTVARVDSVTAWVLLPN